MGIGAGARLRACRDALIAGVEAGFQAGQGLRRSSGDTAVGLFVQGHDPLLAEGQAKAGCFLFHCL